MGQAIFIVAPFMLGDLTEWLPVGVGVSQGCSVSPLLFSIYLEFVSVSNELNLARI